MSEQDWNWGDSGNTNNQWSQQQHQQPDYSAWNQQQNYPADPYAQSPPSANNSYYDQWNQSGAPGGYASAAPPPNQGYGGNAQYGNQFNPQQFMADPMFNAARQIGGQFAEQQKEKLTQYFSSFNLKYYFAVDTSYVGKKLGILLFPFAHRDWATQFGGDGKPVPAKLDINAPDLYVPLMALITYVLISGFVFGVQARFTPERLGMQTTNALFYLFLENMIVLVTKYVLNISQSLSIWHTLAYSGYKFVCIDVCLILFLFGGSSIYYWTLAYMVVAVTIFLARTLKSFILDMPGGYNADDGKKRKYYMLLSIVITQALLMYLLTSSVTSYMSDNYDFAKMAMSKIGLKSSNVPLTPDGEVDYEALLKMP